MIVSTHQSQMLLLKAAMKPSKVKLSSLQEQRARPVIIGTSDMLINRPGGGGGNNRPGGWGDNRPGGSAAGVEYLLEKISSCQSIVSQDRMFASYSN